MLVLLLLILIDLFNTVELLMRSGLSQMDDVSQDQGKLTIKGMIFIVNSNPKSLSF